MARDDTLQPVLNPSFDQRRLISQAQSGDLEAFSAVAMELMPRLVRQATLLAFGLGSPGAVPFLTLPIAR